MLRVRRAEALLWALALSLAACGSRSDADAANAPAQQETVPGEPAREGAAGRAGSAGTPGSAIGEPGSSGSASSTGEPDAMVPTGEPMDADPHLPPSAARVLAFDGEQHIFAIYDETGRMLHDHWPRLGIDGPTPSVSVSWDAWTIHADNAITSTRIKLRAAGLPDPPSTRLVVATELPGGGVHVEVWAVDGTLRAEVELTERWEHFVLSPAEGYLFVERTPVPEVSFELEAAVVRIATGELVWQGAHSSAAFARDDSHFVVAPGRDDPVALVDLTTGQETGASNPDVYKYEQAVQLDVEACSSQGAVLRTYGWINDGQPLWWLDWNGELRAFDPALPRLAEEIFLAFGDDGASVAWRRNAKEPVNGLTPIDASLLGYFEHDVASGDNESAMPPDYDCPAGHSHRFELQDTELEACACATEACELVAQLPAVEPGWERWPGPSPQGGFVLVTAGWPRNALPTTSPEAFLFDAGGEPIAVLPTGNGEFDRDDRLLLWDTWAPDSRTGIVELHTGMLTWLPTPFWSAVVYQ